MTLPYHKAPSTVVRRVPECVHRGGVLRTDKTTLCPKTGDTLPVDIYYCGVHGECVHRAATARHLNIRGCTGCEDATDKPPAKRSPPDAFLLANDGRSAMHLEGMFQGASCFLVCGGPSLNEMDLSPLQGRGVLVAAVNNVAATHVRPHLWFAVDGASSFHEAIWRDPGIMKFVRRDRSHNKIRTADGDRWKDSDLQANRSPNVWFYKYATDNCDKGFHAETFLTHNPPIWAGTYTLPNGNPRETRSCMLPAIRLLYWLGVRTVYLLGADFNMETEQPYAFHELKSRGACGSNNTTYGVLGHWFRDLRPVFDAAGYRVLNATPGSRLDAFERIDFADAIADTSGSFPQVESVRGLYG